MKWVAVKQWANSYVLREEKSSPTMDRFLINEIECKK
jgi:hypothetical protein